MPRPAERSCGSMSPAANPHRRTRCMCKGPLHGCRAGMRAKRSISTPTASVALTLQTMHRPCAARTIRPPDGGAATALAALRVHADGVHVWAATSDALVVRKRFVADTFLPAGACVACPHEPVFDDGGGDRRGAPARVCDGATAQLWDMRTGGVVASVAHPGHIRGSVPLALADDGDVLYAGDRDQVIRYVGYRPTAAKRDVIC